MKPGHFGSVSCVAAFFHNSNLNQFRYKFGWKKVRQIGSDGNDGEKIWFM